MTQHPNDAHTIDNQQARIVRSLRKPVVFPTRMVVQRGCTVLRQDGEETDVRAGVGRVERQHPRPDEQDLCTPPPASRHHWGYECLGYWLRLPAQFAPNIIA